MEAIVIILLVFSFISALSKKARETTATRGGGSAQRAAKRPVETAARGATHSSRRPQRSKSAMSDLPLSERETMTPSVAPSSMEGISLSQRNEYVGSLGVGSMEGEDVCDPSLGHEDARPDLHPAYAEQPTQHVIGYGLTPDKMMQAVVMSEILTRPAQRKWGRR